MRKVNLNILIAVCVFIIAFAGPVVARTIYVDLNGGADFTSIQAAIDDPYTVDGDEIAVLPGTYNEAIVFLGKAIRLYSTGGPNVTVINASRSNHIYDYFSDNNYDGWKIVDEGNYYDPSNWVVINFLNFYFLTQGSNIYSEQKEEDTRRGTYALWQESFYWKDYSVNLNMISGDDDMIGVMFRYKDHDNYYRFSWDRERSQMWLGKMIDGVFTILDSRSEAYLEDTWYNVHISAQGSQFYVVIDGVYYLSANDSSLDYGPIALYCWANDSSWFNSVHVTRVYQQYHVVQCISGEDQNTILEGFTITGGNANGPGPNDQRGGGIYCLNSSPTIIDCNITGNTAKYGSGMCNDTNSSPTVINCTFKGNSATYIGGGMFNDTNSSPTVINCTFTGNSATDEGGGMINGLSSPTVTNCTFSANTVSSDFGEPRGGGMSNLQSSPAVTNCTFSANTASSDFGEPRGGGMYNYQSSPTVINCTFSENIASPVAGVPSQGGGMYNYQGSPMVTNCTFIDNSARDGGGMINDYSSPRVANCIFTDNLAISGGGIFNLDNSNPIVTNCVFSSNSSMYSAGGMYNYQSSPTVTNCTFNNNSVDESGCGGIYNYQSSPIVTNCILWGDMPNEIVDNDSTTTVTYSDVQFVWPGIGNINADPLFVDANAGDFRLSKPNSPCVDKGDNSAPNLFEPDLDGNPRVVDGDWCSAAVVDMGAYEHQGPTTLLQVNIGPQEAVDAGAGWRLVGQTQWCDSNNIIYDLAPGYYEVEFRQLETWIEPEVISVSVMAGVPIYEMGEYKELSFFDIGQIPSRDAPHGRTLDFYVYSDKLGPTASLSCSEPNPLPSGPVSFDANTGLFNYEPNDLYDCTPFEVTFTATLGYDVNEQTIKIRPVPDLPPEYSIVSRPTQNFPDPCSRDYMFVNEIDLQDPCDPNTFIFFNATKRLTRSITIAGKSIVLVAGSQYYTLYDDYHNNADINDITFYAETVIIRDPLHLPQTNVTIYARELIVEDDGSIDTTPLGDWLPVHTDGQCHPEDAPVDGNDGHAGGNISLYIGSFSAAEGGGPRFITNGGRGQDPEPGKNGTNGTNVYLATGWPQAPSRPQGLTFIEAYNDQPYWRGPYYSPYDMTPDEYTPKAGTDAIPAGKPGNGGAGGDLISTLDLSAYVQSGGGQSGNRANGGVSYTGGQNGTPNPAHRAVLHHHESHMPSYWCWYPCESSITPPAKQADTILIYWARPALNGEAPPADMPIGTSGKTLLKPRPFAWLSPHALKMVIAHAKNAYLYGYATEAQNILQEYYELLETYMELAEWSKLSEQWRFDFEQMHDEIGTLLHRLANGLDYFGNPPDWVPLLSFEVLEEVYEDEIDHAIRVLYLSYWLQNNAQELEQTMEALQTGREKLFDQTIDFRTEYEDVVLIIGPLETEAAELAAKIGRADAGGCSGLLCRLKEKEAELVQLADENVEARYKLPEWKKALRAIGTIVGSISTGGSRGAEGKTANVLVGIAGGGLSAAMDEFLDDPDPWPAINMRTDVVKQFNSIEFDDATTGWLGNFDDITDLSQLEQPGAIEDYLQSMRNDAEQMAEGLYDVKESLMTTLLSNEEVEAELKKIKAEDPQFTALVDDITELMVEKEVFNRKLAAAMQRVSMLSNGITNNLLAIDSMNRQGSSISQILDPSVVMYVKDMERRALERLQKYHYYMAKAYEYRLLLPYEGDLDIQEIFEDMKDIVSFNGTLSDSDFGHLKDVYQEELRIMTQTILETYLDDPSERNTNTYYELSPEELQKLNSGEPVTINFVDRYLFGSDRENIRIVNMEVTDNIEVTTIGDPGSFGTVYIKMIHPGLSRLQYLDNIYQFRHLAHDTKEVLNIIWESDWHKNGIIEHVKPSAGSNSLLWMLLGLFGKANQDNALLYSRPGARAGIVITKEINSEKPCKFDINKLELKIDYDFYRKLDELQTLRVVTDSNLPGNLPGYNMLPYFVVNAPDEAARQDGIGDFYRIYDYTKTRYVSVTAPDSYGYWIFVCWTDRYGLPLGYFPTLNEIDLKPPPYQRADKTIFAQYLYDGPLPSPADFNIDFLVNFKDYAELARAWLTTSADPNWDPKYDISDPPDNYIGRRDLMIFCENWLTFPQ